MPASSYLRFPHLHADQLTFVAEDDVWVAPLAGGRAFRVSADHVPVTSPRFSNDGTTIAWTSTRDAAPEVFVAPTEGGPSRRLTYWGAGRTNVRGWLPDGRVLAVSTVGQMYLRHWYAHAVPLDGGASERLPYGLASDVAVNGNGKVLTSTPSMAEPAWRKRYLGGTASRLWIGDANGDFTRLFEDIGYSLAFPLWWGDRIGFASEHEGTGQLYSAQPDGSDLRKHTDLPFYVRHATSDGNRVVFQSGGDLWLIDGPDAEAQRIDVRLGGASTGRQPRPAAAGKELRRAAPDRTGRGSAVEVRGTIHWLTHRDGPARALAATPGARRRLPVVLGETGKAAWVTDAEGDDAIEIGSIEGGEPERFAAGDLGRVLGLEASPNGKWLVAASHDGRLLRIDTESHDVQELAQSGYGEMSGVSFSPDSAWVAWSQPTAWRLQQVRIARLADLEVIDVTPVRFFDFDPVFTGDGKHLAFLSVRSLDPVYDSYVFDLSFPGGFRPHLVPLAATTPSPFAASRDGRAVGPEANGDKADGPPETVVDVEGLAERIVPFPVEAARYSELQAVEGGVVWQRQPLTGVLGDDLAGPEAERPRTKLERFDFAKRKVDVLVEALDAAWPTGDGKRIVVKDKDALKVIPADRKVDPSDTDSAVTVDLSRVRAVIDPGAEWAQGFAEVGRLMRDNFWRADLGGHDWAAAQEKYRPLVERLGSHDDFVDLLWELQGEMDASHAYVNPQPNGGDPAKKLGLLGADLRRDGDVWRVQRILPGESSDPKARSPLAGPGAAVRTGDAIVAVDGRPVDPVVGPGQLLVGTAGKPVELAIAPADGGDVRHIVVTPLGDEEALRYQAHVAERRAYVHEESGGRLGYLHVPDMIGSGWAQLHRDLRVEVVREGLIVDVRRNRGGHTSQLVVEKLARKIVGWTTARGFDVPKSYPEDAPRGPVVTVADQFAGSDGDIVTSAIKALGIGPVVGQRTWGGVIGIDGKYTLVDGTSVTQPRYSFWLEGGGWGVENYGVDPDVEVPMTPSDWSEGRDPQLDTAIRIALERLAETPAGTSPQPPPV